MADVASDFGDTIELADDSSDSDAESDSSADSDDSTTVPPPLPSPTTQQAQELASARETFYQYHTGVGTWVSDAPPTFRQAADSRGYHQGYNLYYVWDPATHAFVYSRRD